MPAKHIIDFDAIDLSEIVATRDELAVFLKQRGRFAMLDGILYENVEQQVVVGFKEIRSDDWWTEDHIPGRPLFPGALMCETAAQLGTYDYMKHRGKVEDGSFVGFGGLDRVRFRGIVEPECRMIFAVRLRRARRSMFVYEAQGFVDQRLVFEAEVIGVVV